MLRVVKVRLYPTEEQQNILAQTFGSTRFVYNYMLDKSIKAYQSTKKTLNVNALKKELPTMKKGDFPWLKDVDSTSLQYTILNMEKAYKRFFNGGGFPKFKAKHDSRQSYQTTTARLLGDKLYLPKVKLVKMRGMRDFEGKLKTVTVSFEAGQYHASLLFDDGKEFVEPQHNGEVVGLDIGVVILATLSNGDMHQPLELDKELASIKKAQRSLSRKKKGSKNRAKAKRRLQRKHLKVVNKRKDFNHKLSNEITNENQVIVIEDLNIKNMTKNATGTVEEPKKSSGKRGLNRVITQQSWGEFFSMLKYKAILKGGEVIKVDPKYTSQECSCCGHISKSNRKSQSSFKCVKCGHTMNADLNASINIRNRGIEKWNKAIRDRLNGLNNKLKNILKSKQKTVGHTGLAY